MSWSLTLLGLVLNCFAVGAEPNLIPMSESQLDQLGIRLTHPTAVQETAMERIPARVIVPPSREFVVSVPLEGLATRVLVAAGERVRSGQALAYVNSPNALSLQRQLVQAATNERLTRMKLGRDESLYKEGILALMRVQEARGEHDRASAELREAEQAASLAGLNADAIAKVKSVGELTPELAVRAPAAGMILERNILIGQRVDAYTPLFRIADPQHLMLEMAIPHERLSSVHMGEAVTLGDSETAARITIIGGNVDPHSQTVPVWAELEREDHGLRPGQQVIVVLQHDSSVTLLSVPAAALAGHAGRRYVFVRVAQGFEPRVVEVAGEANGRAVLRNGLTPNDAVAEGGVAAIKAAWVGIGGADD